MFFFVWLIVYLSVFLVVCLSVFLFICFIVFVCMYICLSVCLVCFLSVCLTCDVWGVSLSFSTSVPICLLVEVLELKTEFAEPCADVFKGQMELLCCLHQLDWLLEDFFNLRGIKTNSSKVAGLKGSTEEHKLTLCRLMSLSSSSFRNSCLSRRSNSGV